VTRTGRGSYGSTHELVQLHMVKHMQTGKALLLSVDGDEDAAVWLPKSQIDVTESDEKGYLYVTMPEWLAKKNELL
jgi:hypothetical protein